MKWINGNKTIIGQALIIALMVFQSKIDPEIFNSALVIIGGLTGASAVHHIKKQVKKN